MAKFDLKMTTTLDFSANIQRRLIDAERQVFVRHRARIMDHITTEWSGWKYDGRPDDAPRNVSQAAWKSTIETTESAASLVIENKARAWNDKSKGYVIHVRRHKGAVEEWKLVAADLGSGLFVAMTKDMTAAIMANLSQPSKPQTLNARGGGPTVRAAGLSI